MRLVADVTQGAENGRRAAARGATPGRHEDPPDPFGDVVAPTLRLIRGGADAAPLTHADPVPPPPSDGATAGPAQPEDAVEVAETTPAPAGADEAPLDAPAIHRQPEAASPESAIEPAAIAAEALAIEPPVRRDEATIRLRASAAAPRRGALDAGARRSTAGQLWRAVVLGLAVAAAIVALALAVRPAAAPAGDEAPAAATALGSGPTPLVVASAATEAAATPVAQTRVRLRLSPGLSPDDVQAFAAAARAAGYAAVDPMTMPAEAPRSRIEYFAPADRAAAEALARALAPAAGELIETRNLADLAGPDSAGRIEAWIATTGDASR